MDGNEWYKGWFNSPYYHKLYFDRDDEEAGAFINKLVEHLKPQSGARMLDVACGKGRHAKMLASLGFRVTGLDISPESIDEALKFQTDNLEFHVHDMRLPFHGNYFDYAFNFFTSFGYFKTLREHNDAIRSICRSLKKNGVFMIDYLNVRYAEDHLQPVEEKEIEGTVYTIKRWHDETHFSKEITISDPSLTEPIRFTERVAKFSLSDLSDMLSSQGMQVGEVFGDYAFGPYHISKTPRLIILAAKRNAKPADKEKRLYSDGRATDALT